MKSKCATWYEEKEGKKKSKASMNVNIHYEFFYNPLSMGLCKIVFIFIYVTWMLILSKEIYKMD